MRTKRAKVSPVDFWRNTVLPSLTLEDVYPGFQGTGSRIIRGNCPLPGHEGDGNSKSFAVYYPDLGFSCFSHCRSGDALDALARFKGLSSSPKGADFVELVRDIARDRGIDTSPLDETLSPERLRAYEARKVRALILEAALDVFRETLGEDAGRKVSAYLTDRGFTPDHAEQFGLGAFPSKDVLKERLIKAGFTPEQIEETHLLSPTARPWEGSLVGAWRDSRGTLRAFWSRTLKTEEADAGKKYLTLQGSGEYRPPVYGLGFGFKGDKSAAVLAEGYLDALTLQKAGFYALALGGKLDRLNAARWGELSTLGLSSVTLATDNDKNESGREGLEKALENYNRNKGGKGTFPSLVFVIPPETWGKEKDPDAFLRTKGAEAFREVLEAKVPAVRYQAGRLLEGITPESPEGKKREAVYKAGLFIESFRGAWAELDTEAVLEEVEKRTGYTGPALVPILEASEQRGKKEREEQNLREALRDAERGLHEGEDAGAVRHGLRSTLDRLDTTGEEPPPTHLDLESVLLRIRNRPKKLSTGWKTLDDLGFYLYPQEYSLIAGRTSHAKTSVLVGLAWNILRTEGDGLVLFYSLEEPEEHLVERLLVLETCRLRDQQKSRNAWTTEDLRRFYEEGWAPGRTFPGKAEDIEAAEAAVRSYQDRLCIIARPWDADRIAAHARTVAAERTVSLVMVDYSQKVKPPRGNYSQPYERIAATHRALKDLAKETCLPVVAGAQINRESVPSSQGWKDRGKKSFENALNVLKTARPIAEHLREGGEQEADSLLGLLNYAKDYPEDGEYTVPETTPLDVAIIKGRATRTNRWASLALEGRYRYIRDRRNGGDYDVPTPSKKGH